MLRTLYFTTHTKVKQQLMKCFVLYILLRIPRLDKHLMKCFVLYVLLRIPRLKTVNEMLRNLYFTTYTKVK